MSPERVKGWFTRFADRHGGVVRTVLGAEEVVVLARDGATATVRVPFGPLDSPGEHDGLAVAPLVAHLLVSRTVGLLLVRRGGHSVGVARDAHVLVSRTGRRLVQGRSAAGGWSQQRFARRRAGQARQALETAAADAVDVLVPRLADLDAVVLGGDRTALDTLREDRRLAPVFALALHRVLDVPEPRRSVLDDAAEQARAVEIVIADPPS